MPDNELDVLQYYEDINEDGTVDLLDVLQTNQESGVPWQVEYEYGDGTVDFAYDPLTVDTVSDDLAALLEEMLGEGWELSLPYFEEYDAWREEVAAEERLVTEEALHQDFLTDIDTAMGQIGSQMAAEYAEGRTGQTGWGGTDPLSPNYANIFSQQRELDEFAFEAGMDAAQLQEYIDIHLAQDEYSDYILSMIGMLMETEWQAPLDEETIIELSEQIFEETGGEFTPESFQAFTDSLLSMGFTQEQIDEWQSTLPWLDPESDMYIYGAWDIEQGHIEDMEALGFEGPLEDYLSVLELMETEGYVGDFWEFYNALETIEGEGFTGTVAEYTDLVSGMELSGFDGSVVEYQDFLTGLMETENFEGTFEEFHNTYLDMQNVGFDGTTSEYLSHVTIMEDMGFTGTPEEYFSYINQGYDMSEWATYNENFETSLGFDEYMNFLNEGFTSSQLIEEFSTWENYYTDDMTYSEYMNFLAEGLNINNLAANYDLFDYNNEITFSEYLSYYLQSGSTTGSQFESWYFENFHSGTVNPDFDIPNPSYDAMVMFMDQNYGYGWMWNLTQNELGQYLAENGFPYGQWMTDYGWTPQIYSSWSDIRLKENITKVGTSPSGINIYEFDYIDKKYGEGRYRGVMAQEVPNAKIKASNGYYKVDYSKLDVDFERLK